MKFGTKMAMYRKRRMNQTGDFKNRLYNKGFSHKSLHIKFLFPDSLMKCLNAFEDSSFFCCKNHTKNIHDIEKGHIDLNVFCLYQKILFEDVFESYEICAFQMNAFILKLKHIADYFSCYSNFLPKLFNMSEMFFITKKCNENGIQIDHQLPFDMKLNGCHTNYLFKRYKQLPKKCSMCKNKIYNCMVNRRFMKIIEKLMKLNFQPTFVKLPYPIFVIHKDIIRIRNKRMFLFCDLRTGDFLHHNLMAFDPRVQFFKTYNRNSGEYDILETTHNSPYKPSYMIDLNHKNEPFTGTETMYDNTFRNNELCDIEMARADDSDDNAFCNDRMNNLEKTDTKNPNHKNSDFQTPISLSSCYNAKNCLSVDTASDDNFSTCNNPSNDHFLIFSEGKLQDNNCFSDSSFKEDSIDYLNDKDFGFNPNSPKHKRNYLFEECHNKINKKTLYENKSHSPSISQSNQDQFSSEEKDNETNSRFVYDKTKFSTNGSFESDLVSFESENTFENDLSSKFSDKIMHGKYSNSKNNDMYTLNCGRSPQDFKNYMPYTKPDHNIVNINTKSSQENHDSQNVSIYNSNMFNLHDNHILNHPIPSKNEFNKQENDLDDSDLLKYVESRIVKNNLPNTKNIVLDVGYKKEDTDCFDIEEVFDKIKYVHYICDIKNENGESSQPINNMERYNKVENACLNTFSEYETSKNRKMQNILYNQDEKNEKGNSSVQKSQIYKKNTPNVQYLTENSLNNNLREQSFKSNSTEINIDTQKNDVRTLKNNFENKIQSVKNNSEIFLKNHKKGETDVNLSVMNPVRIKKSNTESTPKSNLFSDQETFNNEIYFSQKNLATNTELNHKSNLFSDQETFNNEIYSSQKNLATNTELNHKSNLFSDQETFNNKIYSSQKNLATNNTDPMSLKNNSHSSQKYHSKISGQNYFTNQNLQFQPENLNQTVSQNNSNLSSNKFLNLKKSFISGNCVHPMKDEKKCDLEITNNQANTTQSRESQMVSKRRGNVSQKYLTNLQNNKVFQKNFHGKKLDRKFTEKFEIKNSQSENEKLPSKMEFEKINLKSNETNNNYFKFDSKEIPFKNHGKKINNEKMIDKKINHEKINKGNINGKKINDKKINDKKINDEKINDEKINDEKINDEKINKGNINVEKINDEIHRKNHNNLHDIDLYKKFSSSKKSRISSSPENMPFYNRELKMIHKDSKSPLQNVKMYFDSDSSNNSLKKNKHSELQQKEDDSSFKNPFSKENLKIKTIPCNNSSSDDIHFRYSNEVIRSNSSFNSNLLKARSASRISEKTGLKLSFYHEEHLHNEAMAYAQYLSTLLPKNIPLDTKSSIFPQLTNGLILAYIINSIHPNLVNLRKIILLKKSDPNYKYECASNLNYLLEKIKSLKINLVNIGTNDIIGMKHNLVLGLLWQIIRYKLTKDVNIKELMDLKLPSESVNEFEGLKHEEILLRWVDKMLERVRESEFYEKLINQCDKEIKALQSHSTENISYNAQIHPLESIENNSENNCNYTPDYLEDNFNRNSDFLLKIPFTCKNFSKDIKDSKIYLMLLSQINNTEINQNDILKIWAEKDNCKRAEKTLEIYKKINCKVFIEGKDIINGDSKLNYLFVQNLMTKNNLFYGQKDIEKKFKEKEREIMEKYEKLQNEILEMETKHREKYEKLEKEYKEMEIRHLGNYEILNNEFKEMEHNWKNKSLLCDDLENVVNEKEKELRNIENHLQIKENMIDELKKYKEKINNLETQFYKKETEYNEEKENKLKMIKIYENEKMTSKNTIKEIEDNLKVFLYKIEKYLEETIGIQISEIIKDENIQEEEEFIENHKTNIWDIIKWMTTEIKILTHEKENAVKELDKKKEIDKLIDQKLLEYISIMKSRQKKKKKAFDIIGCN